MRGESKSAREPLGSGTPAQSGKTPKTLKSLLHTSFDVTRHSQSPTRLSVFLTDLFRFVLRLSTRPFAWFLGLSRALGGLGPVTDIAGLLCLLLLIGERGFVDH